MDNLSIVALELGKVLLVPSSALIVSLAIGVILLWSRFQKTGRWLTTIAGLALLFAAILPISEWLSKPLEKRFPPIRQLHGSVEGIIVLGGAFPPNLDWGQPQLNDHADRLTAFVALARKHPNIELVFSGGAAAFRDQSPTESDVARELFASLGMDTDRIIFENQSRNTCENALYTAQLVKPTGRQTWVLVTSAMHMPRAVGAFRKAGFHVLPYPVDYTTHRSATLDLLPTLVGNLDRLDYAVHEWLGLLGYRLWDCTDTLFPEP